MVKQKETAVQHVHPKAPPPLIPRTPPGARAASSGLTDAQRKGKRTGASKDADSDIDVENGETLPPAAKVRATTEAEADAAAREAAAKADNLKAQAMIDGNAPKAD